MDSISLQKIIDAEYQLPDDVAIDDLTPQLLQNLGSTDSDLRENSYTVLGGLIGKTSTYQPPQLREIGEKMLQNLTHGIGEAGTNTVFLRAFSLLILEAIIDAESRQHFLTDAEIHEWLDKGLAHLAAEQDLRGYTAKSGWAHAIAHAADFCSVMAINRHLNTDDLKRILNAIADKVIAPAAQILLYQEDDRLSMAVYAVLLRNLLNMDNLKTWLQRFVEPPNGLKWGQSYQDEAHQHARHNTVTFLRSLYFQMKFGVQYVHQSFDVKVPAHQTEMLDAISDTLKNIDTWIYAKPE